MASRKRNSLYMAFKDSHIKRVYFMQMQSRPMTPQAFLRAIREFKDQGSIVTKCDSGIRQTESNSDQTSSSASHNAVLPFYSKNDSSENSNDYFEVTTTSSSNFRTTLLENNAPGNTVAQRETCTRTDTILLPTGTIKSESRLEEHSQTSSNQPETAQTSSDDAPAQHRDEPTASFRPQCTRPPDFFGTTVPSSLRGMLGVSSATDEVRDAVPVRPDEIRNNRSLVERARESELTGWRDHQVFDEHTTNSPDERSRALRTLWIEMWKTNTSGSRYVKSRLCIQGQLEKDNYLLQT